MIYAPVKITTLSRSKHFIRLVESLKRNGWAKYTDVYVGLDFPPSEKYRRGWEKICEYIDGNDFSAFASFNVIRRTENWGASRNSSDVTEYIRKKHDRWISLEDDLEVSPNFIEYMDKCLDYYEKDPNVILVSGYTYPVDWMKSNGATCMLQDFSASTWGRGYWSDKAPEIARYVVQGKMLEDVGKVIEHEIYKKMIDASLREYIHAAVYPYGNKFMKTISDMGLRAYLPISGKYGVSPIVSKVRNHGFDGSGLYCQEISGEGDCLDARSYNYSEQPIDEQETFELVLNDESYLDENRERLNRFDSRTPSEMRETRFLIWLMVHVGVWAAKLYVLFAIPYDVAKRGFAKIRRCYFK